MDSIVASPLAMDDAQDQVEVAAAELKAMLGQGIRAAQSGNRSLARMSLQRATEIDPLNESAWLWLASISEYPEELLGFLDRVLEVNPENPRALEWRIATHTLLSKTFVQRGIDACEENQKDFALECFQTALEYDDRNATAYVWNASLSDSNAVKVSLLERALDIDPENEPALKGLEAAKNSIVKASLTEAKSASVSGKNADAITILDDLLALIPESIDAWTMRSHLAEGFDDKIRCFESILSLDPDNLAARSGRDSLLAVFGTMNAKTDSSENELTTFQPVVQILEPVIEKITTQDLEFPVRIVAEDVQFEDSDEYADYGGSVIQFPSKLAQFPNIEILPEVENDSDTIQTGAEPFASYAAEVPEPSTVDIEQIAIDASEPSNFYEDQRRDSDADPRAETIAFTYEEASQFSAPENAEPGNISGEFVIPMPNSKLPDGPTSNMATRVEATESVEAKPESVPCFFCGHANDPQSITCQTCLAVLTLSDLELLLANQNADKLTLRQAVEEMERTRASRDLTTEELTVLGIGHLNLRNLHLGYSCLTDASHLDPNNVVLSGQVNSLHIRLEEIKRQEEAHLKMPKGKSVLVVDDSATVRKLISDKLQKSGHQVVCANDGVEAMERLNDFVPDLILLDIEMPRMDGYQVCKNIRGNNATKDVPVVMISGKDGFFDKVRGRMAGTTGYITKPFGPETLMKMVEMHLSGEAPDLDEV